MPKRLTTALILALFVLIRFTAGSASAPLAAALQVPTATPTLTPLPTFTPFPSATPLPTLTPSLTPLVLGNPLPTPVLTATPGCAAPLGLVIGGVAYVRGGVNVRAAPSASSAQVNYTTENTVAQVLEGPVCDGIYNWWRVEIPGNGGWIAEGRPGRYWIYGSAAPRGTPTCGSPLGFKAGTPVELLFGLRVRERPALNGLTLTVAPAGAVVNILEGPVCGEGYNWWRVQVTVLNIVYSGWVAEGERGEGDNFLQPENFQPTPVCAPPLDFSVGSRAYVDYPVGEEPKNLRVAPGVNTELIATLIDGIGFEIIGSPICADGLNWWPIRILSRPDVQGWFAEGGPTNYWVTPRGNWPPSQYDVHNNRDQ
ncbi:MAG: SH3 domain-containing protein [Chloroflexi bacterium]|nr:SH3 domain-containing protein [Chloroflexota bacterium]